MRQQYLFFGIKSILILINRK